MQRHDKVLLSIGVHRKTFKKYIVKQPHPDLPKEEGLQHFEIELKRCLLRQKTPPVGVAKVLYSEMGDFPYILEEMGQYGNVYTLVKHRKANLKEEECRAILRQVFPALRHLHKQNISHGGISLHSIFLTNEAFDAVLSGPIDPTCTSQRDLVMLGTACCVALSGVGIQLASPSQPSEKKMFLDPNDMAIVKKALPDIHHHGNLIHTALTN